MDENTQQDSASAEVNEGNSEGLVVSSENKDENFKDTNMACDVLASDNAIHNISVVEDNSTVIVNNAAQGIVDVKDDSSSVSETAEANLKFIKENLKLELHNTTQVEAVANSSLSLLAQYSSDSSISSASSSASSSDSECSEASGMEVDSSDNENSTNSSTATEYSLNAIKKKIEELDDAEDLANDDEIDEKGYKGPIKAPGELGIEDLPPIEDLHISVPESDCTMLGKITSIVDQLVLVESLPNIVPLDLDSVLFLDKGVRPLGKIFDVLGQVHCPIYCVRFNSKTEIEEKGIVIGLDVYCAPAAPCTSIVILPNLMKHKGSDASWKNDIEPPERYIEFSDDEQEKNARKPRKPRNTEESQPSANRNGQRTGPAHKHKRQPQDEGSSHHSSHDYPRPNHHRMPIPAHMFQQPQFYYPPPGMYPNPFCQPDPRYYVNPFAYSPTNEQPAFNPNIFNGPPPPPPPPPNQ